MKKPFFFEKTVIYLFQISQELLHIGPILKHNQMMQYSTNKRLGLDGE